MNALTRTEVTRQLRGLGVVPAREVVDIVAGRLRAEPEFFLHPKGSDCRQCEEAWSSLEKNKAPQAVSPA